MQENGAKIISPKIALNKAFFKVKPSRDVIENFKTNLIDLMDKIDEPESEEFHKNLVSDFLKAAYYRDKHYINTKDRKDLVIYNGKDAKSNAGVVIEVKTPTNTSEMLKKSKLNTKAFQELLLYYLRERISEKNTDIKYLIATNIHEWFIFDAHVFEKAFAQNKKLVANFTDFEAGRSTGNTTDFFYREIAAPAIEKAEDALTFTWFDIRDYEKILRNADKKDDKQLIALYKIFSPEHLLKLPFTNDSNSLDQKFYTELLHIIGLGEIKQKGKKLIERNPEGQRNSGSLLENAINVLDSRDKISQLNNPSHFGVDYNERLFNVALELVITWINRILFLKLLEAQQINYHKGDKSYAFLNIEMVKNFDDLDSLFFSVLARRPEERDGEVKELFSKVPYLNSSLFEPTGIEHGAIFVSNLRDERELLILSSSVLKDTKGKKRSGKLNTLEYLFEFLDAYDFSSEGSGDIQEENKTLINASVLGLVFEKINGYKDGSFFTPGFITMYMCREAISRAVLQKFNEVKGWNCEDMVQLFNQIEDKQEANKIINSLKICDPAVGSGHFLVSALNEIIVIKHDLEILVDKEGKRLRGYNIEVVNDELVISDDNGDPFEYSPKSKESQRIQETLFHEKQTIIENCLFGVDINHNSVKICRLRLWIELLKNAYYKADGQLETLPNIDINIKCGNSLISRYALDTDIRKALKKSKFSIQSYRTAVMAYRNAQSKEQKRAMEKLIEQVKNDFETEIDHTDKRNIRLVKLQNELNTLINQPDFFAIPKAEKNAIKKKTNELTASIEKLENEINEIKNNKIYENAFEWRFEFPEVLSDDGEFVGFDLIIGNPPYIKEYENKRAFEGLHGSKYYQGKMDIWYLFLCNFLDKLKSHSGLLTFIATNNWVTNSGASLLREKIIKGTQIISLVDFNNYKIFESAGIQTMVMIFKNDIEIDDYTLDYRKLSDNANSFQDVSELLERTENPKNILLTPTFKRHNYLNRYLLFNEKSYNNILDKMCTAGTISLFETDKKEIEEQFESEIGQGVVPPQDFLNRSGYEKLNNPDLNIGVGIFCLSEKEYESINWNRYERQIIKPFYTAKQLKKYYACEGTNETWLIYSGSEFKASNLNKSDSGINIDNYPNIKDHLDKFTKIITSDNKPYGLHRKREKRLFEGEKIMALRKCSNSPCFTYTDFPCYVSQSYNIITSKRFNLKYLTALLNSKLISFWLKYRGKMQGTNYQIDNEPLSQIPIAKPDNEANFISLVDQILDQKQSNPNADTSELEEKIDILVYNLYGLSKEEIAIVEGS